MARLAGILFKTWFLVYFCLTLVLLFPFFFLLLSTRKTYPAAFGLKKIWARILLLGGGIFPRVSGLDNLIKSGPCIVVSNHASYLDIILSYCFLSRYFVFMGKQELRKAPLFGIFFKDMNIAVDRRSKIGSHRAFLRASKELRAGRSLMIFPEATISKKAPRMMPFKNGAFRLAIENGVPIVPVTFLDNFRLLQDKPYFRGIMRPGISRIIVHPAVEIVRHDHVNQQELKALIHSIIEKPLRDTYPHEYH